MPQIRRRGDIAQRWQQRAAAAQGDYARGVQQPRTDWAQATTNAATAWQEGVQRAAAERRFESGVAQAGTPKWQKNTVTKGPARFAQGVGIARDDYATAVAPFLDVIEATQLPARGPKGDPRNIERVRILAENLHNRARGGR